MSFKLLWSLLAVLLLGGCEYFTWQKQKEEAIARVHNKYLFVSDIEGLIPYGTSSQDSATIVSNYISNWIREQLLLHQAERTLAPNQKDFSKQLENYRNSLVIFEYESNMLRQMLDTVISTQEIIDYYEQNKVNFELKENIVIVDFVQVEIDSKELPRLRRLWQARDTRSKTELEKYCIENGLNYSLFDDSWVYFNDLLRDIPISTYNQENFLRFNRSIETRDSLYLYFVEFKDFKIKETTAPLDMQESNIRKIIINRRRLELLQQMQNDIFENAVSNGYFEIFNYPSGDYQL